MISLDRAATEHKRNMAASYPGLAVLAIISIEQAVHSTQRAAGVAANVCSTKLRSVPLQGHSQSWKGDKGKGQQNQGKLKKGFTHSSAVNKLHNSTSNGPATDYETMQTLFISNTSSAIHNSPPKLVANVGKRHSRTPSHVHGRHAFCPLRLFLAAAAGSWEHGRTKPPRGKVGERERRVYRRKGREEEGRRGGSLVVRRRRCC